MKVLETKSGQIFEIWESRKEALHDVADIIDGIRYANKIGQHTDDFLWVQYKDGSHYCINEDGEEGKFKKINIEAIIDENDCTMMIWGKVEIYNIDDRGNGRECQTVWRACSRNCENATAGWL